MSDELPKSRDDMLKTLTNLQCELASFDLVMSFYEESIEQHYDSLSEDDLIDEYVEELSLSEEEEAILRLRLLSDE